MRQKSRALLAAGTGIEPILLTASIREAITRQNDLERNGAAI